MRLILAACSVVVLSLSGTLQASDDVRHLLQRYRLSLQPLRACEMEVVEADLSKWGAESSVAQQTSVWSVRMPHGSYYEYRRSSAIDSTGAINGRESVVILSWLVDGRLYELETRRGESALNVYRRVRDDQIVGGQAPLLCGHLPGLGDRIDEILERSGCSVRPGRQSLRGRDVVVVDAASDGAQYSVWFAPEHDGCILRLQRVLEGDVLRSLMERVPNPSNKRPNRMTQTLDEVRIEKIGGHWMPVSATYSEQITYENAPPFELTRTIDRRGIRLHPRLDGVSFDPLVPDGTRVRFIGERGGIPWEWRAGTVVPREDHATTSRIRAALSEHHFPPGVERLYIALLRGPAILFGTIAAGILILLKLPGLRHAMSM